MRKDYHIHPTILRNPDQFELFVESALSKNIKEICVTDHMPLSFSNATDRIEQGSVGAYCRTVRETAKKYEGVINIKCGIEIDYHPSVISEVERVLQEGDFDFILASSHMHLFIHDYSRYSFNDVAAMALENSIKAVEFGRFHAISHLDMYRWAFEYSERFPFKNDGYDVLKHKDLIDELLYKMAKRDIYLEINPHFAESKQDIACTYPQEVIVPWALEKGVRFSYGSDAHAPSSVGVYMRELEEHPVYGKALKKWEEI